MSTKVKGLLKGLRYISQIFDEEKEPEMQIGLPTDVKHVAHIGWDDGPAVESPGWMKGFESSGAGQQSGRSNNVGESKEKQEVKIVTEDSKKGEHPDIPKSTRRHTNSSPKKERRHHPRRHHHLKDSENTTGSPARDISDIPNKSRRKKSHRSSKSRGSDSSLLSCSSDEDSSFEPCN